MKYFRVKNLDKHQHYKKDTKPAWIKLYANILHDAKLNSLTERQQLFWIKILLYSSQNSNRIPFESKSISNQIGMKSFVDLNLFLDLGMIEIIEDTEKKSIETLGPYIEDINKNNITKNRPPPTPPGGGICKVGIEYLNIAQQMTLDFKDTIPEWQVNQWAETIKKMVTMDKRPLNLILDRWKFAKGDEWLGDKVNDADRLRKWWVDIGSRMNGSKDPPKSTFQKKRDVTDKWLERSEANDKKRISDGTESFPELRGTEP